MRESAAGDTGVTLTGSALLAACLLTSGPACAQPLDRNALARLGRSVLRIEALNESGRVAIGSGVIVADERVVTNCHVTRHASRVVVVYGGTRTSVEAQAADVPHDLCVLSVPGLRGMSVPLASAGSLRQGEALTALGYTGGAGLQISSGSVIALHRWEGGHVIQCSNGFTSGASGGGLFDRHGALVGILTFRLRGGRAHYYAAPADWLRERANGEPSFARVQPLAGLAFWEESTQAQPWFLQAATLEQAAMWDALARLAQRWASQAADDPEPPYLQAVAHEGNGEPDAAIAAWQRSLAIDPAYSRSWARLARLYHRMDRADDAQRALAALMAHDPGLALEVSAELGAERTEPRRERAR